MNAEQYKSDFLFPILVLTFWVDFEMSSGNERDFRVYFANRGTLLWEGHSDVLFAGACPSRGEIMFELLIKRISKFQFSDLMKNDSA